MLIGYGSVEVDGEIQSSGAFVASGGTLTVNASVADFDGSSESGSLKAENNGHLLVLAPFDQNDFFDGQLDISSNSKATFENGFFLGDAGLVVNQGELASNNGIEVSVLSGGTSNPVRLWSVRGDIVLSPGSLVAGSSTPLFTNNSSLIGSGTLTSGLFMNSGVVSPGGNGIGQLDIASVGAFALPFSIIGSTIIPPQIPSDPNMILRSRIEIDIANTHDKIVVDGDLVLGLLTPASEGSLDLAPAIIDKDGIFLGPDLDLFFAEDFAPVGGEVFDIIDADSIIGQFATIRTNLVLPDELFLDLSQLESSGEIRIGLRGDFNSDGAVDGADFLLWQRGGSPNGTTAGDLTNWEDNFGRNVTVISTATSLVPEPSTFTLLHICIWLSSASFCRKRT